MVASTHLASAFVSALSVPLAAGETSGGVDLVRSVGMEDLVKDCDMFLDFFEYPVNVGGWGLNWSIMLTSLLAKAFVGVWSS